MRSSDDRGFVLVTVLWALVLFGTLAVLYLSDSRDLVRISANRSAELHARQAALAGLERTHNILERLHLQTLPTGTLRDRGSRGRWVEIWSNLDSVIAPARAECLELACYEVQVRDLGALLNVNAIDEATLERFFRGLGAEQTEALIAAQSVADWIDPDDDARRFGAERDFYLLSPDPYVPRNAAIGDLAELRLVRGIHPDLYRRARPYLTTRGRGWINVNSAPPAVLAALPGLGSAGAAASLRSQRQTITDLRSLIRVLPADSATGRASRAAGLRGRIVFEPRELEVTSIGRVRGNPLSVTIRALYRRESSGVVTAVRAQVGRP